MDSVFLFGVCSAPKIFSALADELEWVVRQARVKTLLHYLDDFLIIGKQASTQCAEDLQRRTSWSGLFDRPG